MDTRELVHNGAELLNRYFGDESWKTRVDVEKLDLSDGFKCVLGQLFGQYADAVPLMQEELDLPEYDMQDPSEFWAFEYGFNIDVFDTETTFAQLTESWKEYLQDETEKWQDIDELD